MNKNVLIVNSKSIYSNNATGITLRSLFEKINKERLMEIFWEEKCQNNQLQHIFLNYKKCSISKLLMKFRKGKMNSALKSKSKNGDGKYSKLKKILIYLRQYFALIPDMTSIYISNKDIDKISKFKPDVIYTLGGGINALKLSYKLSLKFDVPIVIHHMDNWMNCIQWEENPLLYLYKKELRRYCKKCYTRSNVSLAISDKMAEVYSNEFGVKHYAIMNSIDVSSFKCSETNKQHEFFTFVYAGGLHLNRYQSLIEIGKVIDNLNQNNKKKAILDIYTKISNISLYKKELEKCKCIRLHNSISHDKVKSIYEKADALIHVESSSLVGNEFFKYSISTKVPECLSTGKPFLFYGPNNIYLYQFLEEKKIACTASNEVQLKEIINKIMNNNFEVTKIIENGIEFAIHNFDIQRSLETLTNTFIEAKL